MKSTKTKKIRREDIPNLETSERVKYEIAEELGLLDKVLEGSGITMVFVPALTTFVISDLLGGGKILLIGNVIEQSFKQNSNWHVGSGLSMVLMVFIIASMALVAKYDKEGEGSSF